jgi:hypothetical protein
MFCRARGVKLFCSQAYFAPQQSMQSPLSQHISRCRRCTNAAPGSNFTLSRRHVCITARINKNIRCKRASSSWVLLLFKFVLSTSTPKLITFEQNKRLFLVNRSWFILDLILFPAYDLREPVSLPCARLRWALIYLPKKWLMTISINQMCISAAFAHRSNLTIQLCLCFHVINYISALYER